MMTEGLNTAFDQRRYAEWQASAQVWIAGGGDLKADPPASDEAFENGFADSLTYERMAKPCTR